MKKVKCTDAECTNLTYKKEYQVLNKWKEKSRIKPYEPYDVYLVIDDTGNESVEPSCLFEDIEEKKELNIIDAMKMPVGTEFEVIFDNEKIENNTMIIYRSLTSDNECKHMDWKCHPQDTFMKPYDFLINGIFIPVQNPVSFMEAVASEKNMIKVDIEGIIYGMSDNLKEQLREYNTIGATLYCLSNYFTNESLVKIFQEGKWYIED